MNPPRCQPEDYIQFLLATPKAWTATEAARVQPDRPAAPAHDAFTRLLHRLEPDLQALGAEVRPLLNRADGGLVVDDTTLDKPHGRHIQLVTHHWSGKHSGVVRCINLITQRQDAGAGLDRRRPAVPDRLPPRPQGGRRPDQERPLPRPAGGSPRPRLPARLPR